MCHACVLVVNVWPVVDLLLTCGWPACWQVIGKKRTAVLGARKAQLKQRAVYLILAALATGTAVTAGVVAIPQIRL